MQLGHFSIAHPIFNNRFCKRARFSDTLPSGAATTTVPLPSFDGGPDTADKIGAHVVADSLPYQYAGRDTVTMVLGPSTVAGSHLNKIETRDYWANSGGLTATLPSDQALVYQYNSGDPVTVYTQSLPGGWYGDAPNFTINHGFSFGRIVAPDNFPDDSGLHDPYCFSVQNVTGSTTNFASLKIGKLIANHYYRLEARYYCETITGVAFPILNLYHKALGDLNAEQLTLSVQNSWTTASTVFKTETVETIDAYLLLAFPPNCATPGFHISSISLSHAGFTSGTDYTTNGRSQLSAIPNRGSVYIRRLTESDRVGQFSDGIARPTMFQTGLRERMPVTTYQVTYLLENVTKDDMDIVRSLISWQERGHVLNHWPGIIGLPHCMTGRLSMRIVDRVRMEDFDLSSVQLTFEEIIQ